MQHTILEGYPSARLRVYAIWTERRFRDSRSEWDGAGLTDARVVHLWDDADVSGRWLADRLPGFTGDDWDTYALFGPDASWKGTPPLLLSSGSTIVHATDRLETTIRPLIGANGTPQLIAYGRQDLTGSSPPLPSSAGGQPVATEGGERGTR